MFDSLKNKTILVTGAGSGMKFLLHLIGLGYALTKQLSTIGANVIAVSLLAEELEQLRAELPDVRTIQVDLKDWNQVRERLANVPQLDGLVNNAGVTIVKPFAEFTEEEFDFVFDVNIKAVFNVTQTLLPKLKDGASIVNLSSQASSHCLDGHTVYTASKSAVDALTKSLALELGPRKIRVNSVNPTAVLTKMGREVWSDPKKSGPLLARVPLRRFGEVQEVVDGISFLLSSRSSYVNGHQLKLEGGYSVA